MIYIKYFGHSCYINVHKLIYSNYYTVERDNRIRGNN